MADEAKSNRVIDLVDAIVGQTDGQPITLAWMTAEVAGKIMETLEGARTLFEMQGMKQGMTPERAKEMATTQWVLLAFQLGMQVAENNASANAMKDLFGDWNPETED